MQDAALVSGDHGISAEDHAGIYPAALEFVIATPNHLTKELTECLQGLLEMLTCTRKAFNLDVSEHQQTPRERDALKAGLFCSNLEKELQDRFFRAGTITNRNDCDEHFGVLRDQAEKADERATRFRKHGGDARLASALQCIAEALRFTLPALLRWCHGFRGRGAETRIHQLRNRCLNCISA